MVFLKNGFTTTTLWRELYNIHDKLLLLKRMAERGLEESEDDSFYNKTWPLEDGIKVIDEMLSVWGD